MKNIIITIALFLVLSYNKILANDIYEYNNIKSQADFICNQKEEVVNYKSDYYIDCKLKNNQPTPN